MEPMNEITTLALKHSVVTENPIFLALLVLIGLVIALITIASLITNLSSMRSKGQQANAEGSLYSHLSEQAERHAKALDEAYAERNAKIDGEIAQLVDHNKRLEGKLEEKDRIISLRDTRIQELFAVIIEKDTQLRLLTERIHALEMRLAVDESIWCKDCHKRRPLLSSQVPAVIPANK